eukprot:TRINITY_DN1925_c0_g3_i2.p1 TRINITY_DN1925_c0_g3~~TRINITY_DN1925_c0_g3_i2.p1  ORF type:complete len:477 (-),score=117.11 TRINITY_DN1925_c0_g3_i2:1092-2522(-)
MALSFAFKSFATHATRFATVKSVESVIGRVLQSRKISIVSDTLSTQRCLQSGAFSQLRKYATNGDYDEFPRLFDTLKDAAIDGNPKAQMQLGYLFSSGEVARAVEAHYKQGEMGYNPWPDFEKGMEVYREIRTIIADQKRLLKQQRKAERMGLTVEPANAVEAKATTEGAEDGKSGFELMIEEREKFSENPENQSYDDVQAVHWLRKASEQGNPDSKILLATHLFDGRGESTGIAEAFELMDDCISKGSNYAKFCLAQVYYEGRTIERDVEKAIELITSAANNNERNALYWLGHAYVVGQDVEQDVQRGVNYLQGAAQQNHGPSIYYLSQLHATGEYLSPNAKVMMSYLDKGARLSDVDCLSCLASIYFEGAYGIAQDHPKALQYFLEAGKMGNSTAMCSAAAMLMRGLGRERDAKLAFKLYQDAAMAGNIVGWQNLAHMYYHGIEVPKNEAMALHIKKVIDAHLAEAGKGGEAEE